jgi:ABC-2 type transport system permease protein
MAPVWAVIVKEFVELRRDRRSMAMVIALPILLLVVFGYAANFNIDHIKTEVVGPGAEAASKALPPQLQVSSLDPAGTKEDAEEALHDNKADVAVVTSSDTAPVALVDGSELFAAQAAVRGLAQVRPPLATEVLFNPELKTSWVMVPALAGLIMAFIGTIITSLGLVRERQAGTLEQLAVMPLRASDVIGGKVVPYFVLASLDMLVVTILGVLLFGVPFNGSVLVFALGALLFVFVVLGIGVFISTISENQGQAIQTAMFFLMPQILLSGMIFPLAGMPWAIRWIGYVLPLTYFTEIARGVMLRAESFASLWPAFAVLAAMAVLVFGAAVLRLSRDLAPNARRAESAPAPAPVPAT